MSTNFRARNMAEQQIASLDEQLLRRKLRITESPCDTKARVGQRELKAFCSNDYLGLANHPKLGCCACGRCKPVWGWEWRITLN